MALKGRITKSEFDALNEVIKKEYKTLTDQATGQVKKDAQGNELYVLDTPDMEHSDDVRGLRSALENERQVSTSRQSKITQLEGEQTRLSTELEEAKKKKPKEGESGFEADKQQLIAAHTEALDAEKKKGERYRNSLDQVMRRDSLTRAIVKAKGSVDLLLPVLERETQFVEEQDGSFRVVVINDKGASRIGDTQGNPMSLDALVEEKRKDDRFGRAFDATDAGGSGMAADQSRKTGTVVSKKSDLKTVAEKAAYCKEFGHEKYAELPE